jgi:hypothetical protein
MKTIHHTLTTLLLRQLLLAAAFIPPAFIPPALAAPGDVDTEFDPNVNSDISMKS